MVLTTSELVGIFIFMFVASFAAAWTYDKVPHISRIPNNIKEGDQV